jgi:hypothetical protein
MTDHSGGLNRISFDESSAAAVTSTAVASFVLPTIERSLLWDLSY